MKANRFVAGSFAAKFAIATLVLGALALAQDPFGGDPAAAPADGAAKAGEKGAKVPKLEVPPEPKPLLLEYLEENKPANPEQMLSAARIALDIGRPVESKKYLADFVAANPDGAALAAIGRRFGAALFIRLQREKNIQPEGAQVATLVLDAMHADAIDPARLDRLIGELAGADARQRAAVRRSIAEAGVDGVVALLAALADPNKTNLHRQIQITLLEMRRDSEALLVAALASGNETLIVPVAETLGVMKSTPAMPPLVRLSVDTSVSDAVRSAAAEGLTRISGSSPRASEAARYLEKLLEEKLAQAHVLRPATDLPVIVWSWDAATNAPAGRDMFPGDAALIEARNIAADLSRLVPENAYYRRLDLMTALESDKVLTGLNRPLPSGDGTAAARAAEAGASAISGVLAEALNRDRSVAATAAAEMLGRLRDPAALAGSDGGEVPLALALRHSDRRVRITAALAIARLLPQDSFVGASRVSQTLAHFAGTGGARRVLVGHPRIEAGQTLVGYMARLGYEAEVANTGRAFEQKVIENADYEFVLLSDALDRPPVQEVVQWMRRDYRTARLPVGIMARSENLDALRQDMEDDRLTFVFPAVADVEVAADLVRRIERMAGRSLIDRDERVELALSALDALIALARQPPPAPNYDLIRHEAEIIRALAAPGLSIKAAELLGLMGTPNMQSSLADFASENARPLADRQAAAAGFVAAAKTRGVLLTKEQIRRQYDRYNASERLDAPTQELLGSILDAIEARSVAAAQQP